LRDIEMILIEYDAFAMEAWRKEEGNVLAVKSRVALPHGDEGPIVPIFVPELDEVRRFAKNLHARREAWQGEAFGWQAEYNPSRSKPPLDSNMTFTPADFCIGESGIWFFSMMWEYGDEAKPVEFLDNRAIVEGSSQDAYWIERAEQAAQSGFMSVEETATYLQERTGDYQTDEKQE
jgi:hypothetical protein